MNFDLDDDQAALLDAVERLLDRHAGPQRARAVAARGGSDAELESALGDAGFLDLFHAEGGGPLAAALVVEAVARAAGVVPVAARALVAPAVTGRALSGPVALDETGERGPVRFGAEARWLLVAGDDEAILEERAPGDADPVASVYGYPMARLAPAGGEGLGPGSADRMRRWWRVALAVETVGTMRAAFDVTVRYVKDRHQFGRSIASFQAVQHRLAELAVSIEGARWSCLDAAWRGAPAAAAASAATLSTATARQLAPELHQLSGAFGFTIEHDLHVWTMRLQALRMELEGVSGHARAVAAARWLAPVGEHGPDI